MKLVQTSEDLEIFALCFHILNFHHPLIVYN